MVLAAILAVGILLYATYRAGFREGRRAERAQDEEWSVEPDAN